MRSYWVAGNLRRMAWRALWLAWYCCAMMAHMGSVLSFLPLYTTVCRQGKGILPYGTPNMMQIATIISFSSTHQLRFIVLAILDYISLWQHVNQMPCMGFHLPKRCSMLTVPFVGSSWLGPVPAGSIICVTALKWPVWPWASRCLFSRRHAGCYGCHLTCTA